MCAGVAGLNAISFAEQQIDTSLAAMNIGAVHMNTSQLLARVGPPPWNAIRTSLSNPSNLRPEICTRIKPVNTTAYSYLGLPQSFIHLAQVYHTYSYLNPTTFLELVIGYNMSARHSLPISVNILSNILLSLASNFSAGGIAVETHQLPFNTRTAATSAFAQNALQSLLASPMALIASIAGLLYLAFAGAEIVSEREVSFHLSKYVQSIIFNCCHQSHHYEYYANNFIVRRDEAATTERHPRR